MVERSAHVDDAELARAVDYAQGYGVAQPQRVLKSAVA
jgi:hypothetical protein